VHRNDRSVCGERPPQGRAFGSLTAVSSSGQCRDTPTPTSADAFHPLPETKGVAKFVHYVDDLFGPRPSTLSWWRRHALWCAPSPFADAADWARRSTTSHSIRRCGRAGREAVGMREWALLGRWLARPHGGRRGGSARHGGVRRPMPPWRCSQFYQCKKGPHWVGLVEVPIPSPTKGRDSLESRRSGRMRGRQRSVRELPAGARHARRGFGRGRDGAK
jgi:hypothetical protein